VGPTEGPLETFKVLSPAHRGPSADAARRQQGPTWAAWRNPKSLEGGSEGPGHNALRCPSSPPSPPTKRSKVLTEPNVGLRMTHRGVSRARGGYYERLWKSPRGPRWGLQSGLMGDSLDRARRCHRRPGSWVTQTG
jgi:hypothetical protein